MNTKVQAIINRYSLGVDAGPRFAAKFTLMDRMILDTWLAEQRLESSPDADIWQKLLLSHEPFLFTAINPLIIGRRGVIIRSCSTELDIKTTPDVSSEFPHLRNSGLRYMIAHIDSNLIKLYGGCDPLLVDAQDKDCAWCIESENGTSFCFRPAECSDVVFVLLREWKKKLLHFKQAREMLCDLFSVGLAKS